MSLLLYFIATQYNVIILALLFFGFIAFVYGFFSASKSRRIKSKKFFYLFNKKFELGQIKDKEDIVVLAKSFARDEETSFDLGILLEDYLKYLVESTFQPSEIEKKTISEKFALLKRIIEVENEEQPFADLPKEEQRILRSLKNFIEQNDHELAFSDLEDLKLLILMRNQAYDRDHKLNRWSIPLAIIGLLASLYFGFDSVFGKVNYSRIEAIVNSALTSSTLK